MFILLLLLTTVHSATICTPATNQNNWAFQTDKNPNYSCASSAGATNDLGSAPQQCVNDPASVRIQVSQNKAECLIAKSSACKIPMRDFISLDYNFHISNCNGIWAAPLWMTPDKWQWDGGSGEIDSEEFCSRDSIHLNFAGGGHQTKLDPKLFSINDSEGHITVRKDAAGIVTIVACTSAVAQANQGQCNIPVYKGCTECTNSNNTYGCWCNPATNNIYGSGGCAKSGGGDCMWTLVSDAWNGVSGDAGYAGCMTAVPELNLAKGKPYLKSKCMISVEQITLRGSGRNESLQFGQGSPSYCNALTTSPGSTETFTSTSTSTSTEANEIQKITQQPLQQVNDVLKNIGKVTAIEDLVERLFANLSTSKEETFQSPFTFSLLESNQSCGTKAPPCYSITDVANHIEAGLGSASLSISGTTASEIGAGLGFYLREIANMTIGNYSSEKASIANGSTVVLISITFPSSFKSVSLSLSRSPLF